MTHNSKSRRNSEGAAEPKRQGARGKRIRVEATRRERVDPDMIALCYWLIAQRIVQEAGDESGAVEHPEAPTADNDDHATDTPTKDARS